jgi:hypothetical protein
VDFYLIGTDGGYIQYPRKLNHIYHLAAHRLDIVIQ